MKRESGFDSISIIKSFQILFSALSILSAIYSSSSCNTINEYNLQGYETCFQYDLNVTSCNQVENFIADTHIISCKNGYHYDYGIYGETTSTTVSVLSVSDKNKTCQTQTR